ncbi:cytokine-like protein 1 [Myxocyprinus asiaticus]|uniref:cytokine-like protein 1 n=1 Tax=Myxocyprinus asiaticus TaxID=70543 RepID=UPI002222D178|nr:cytokine-like protein 1 [Myxocyprinus asiaticus]
MRAHMRLVSFIFIVSLIWFTRCAPPTCYSRVLVLSKEIMEILDKIHKSSRTKTCAEILPKMFLDVHNSCITTKLRDFLYVLENLPIEDCREKPRIRYLKRRVQVLYTIINRVCYRDLVYFTDECVALETGNSSPRYTEDRLQLLEDEN